MSYDFNLKPVATIKSDFKSKFGIPRQSGLIDAIRSTIVFENEFRNPEALRGLEEFSHLWLIWGFTENIGKPWSPPVRPPKLGGNKRVGVFATRSPFRPNPLGLSSVKIKNIDLQNCSITVSSADLMDGTVIYDIKPYIPYTDCHSDALGGFSVSQAKSLEVICDNELLNILPECKRSILISVLESDPRPAYHDIPNRIYGFVFNEFEIKFSVKGGVLTVKNIIRL